NTETAVSLASNEQTITQRFAHTDQYRLEVDYFASCLRSGRPPILQLEETLENLATIEAIYRSAGYPWPITEK
ncbi:MAG: hypothetical protein H0W02_01680, partial [Ktedonobacteraceae bacterium]|nr:hypothetical protein [Ktedonobacteraceae bacterium]